MCRQIYNWNIVNCDVKQPIQLNSMYQPVTCASTVCCNWGDEIATTELIMDSKLVCSCGADFIRSLLSTGKKHLASRFGLTYRYIDDVLSMDNPEFEGYLGRMCPAELEIRDTAESAASASYLDLLLSIGRDGQLHTSIYDKRDDFNFHITNFPFLSGNIPSSPAYGVFISQLIRYSRACSSYECFILRARRLSSKLLKQGYLAERLKSSFRKFYGRYGDLIQQYEVSLSRMLNDILILDQQWLPNQSDFPPISWPWYRAWPSPNYEWFPWSICNGCG